MDNFAGKFTNLYGPAYKGIPLAVATSMALEVDFFHPTSYTFNRKEAKDHGEGGILIGNQYDFSEKILIIEDVVTVGTSVKETMELLKNYPNAEVVGLIVSVDRMEKVDSGKGALQELKDLFGFKTESIVNIKDIIEFIRDYNLRKEYNNPKNVLIIPIINYHCVVFLV